MQISLKMQFTAQARVALLLPQFYKLISNVMYVPTNKYPISFQNSLSPLSLLSKGEEDIFSHQNLILCQQQHVAQQLQTERAWSKI